MTPGSGQELHLTRALEGVTLSEAKGLGRLGHRITRLIPPQILRRFAPQNDNSGPFAGPLLCPARAGPLPRLRVSVVALALVAGVLASACSQGAYPLDLFWEMHYQQSYKSQEPPRLSAPESAVPRFPAPQATSFPQDGRHLFQVNCALCHGQDAKGTANKEQGPGPVLKTMLEVYGYQEKAPTDLTLFPPDFIDAVLQFTPQPGRPRYFGEGSVMPVFAKLLTPQERQLIVQYIQTLRP